MNVEVLMKILFKDTAEQEKYEKACKLIKKSFRLVKLVGGIGVVTDSTKNAISYELLISIDNHLINFGICLTASELLAKAKLYYQLVKEVIPYKGNDFFDSCQKKASNDPKYRPILIDLQIMSNNIRYVSENKVSKTLH